VFGAPFIAVTGTNGKSTTTALIAPSRRRPRRCNSAAISGRRSSLDPPRTGRYHVIECSSFQIDLAPGVNPSIGVLLNVTPDHLDRHGTLARYAAIKERLVTASGTAVVAVDDDRSQAIADRLERTARRVIRVSARRPLTEGVYAAKGELFAASDGAARRIAGLAGIPSLRGDHNAQNAAAAVAAVRKASMRHDRTGSRLRRSQASHGAGAAGAAVFSSSTIKGHQRRCRRQGRGELRAHLLDRRRATEGEGAASEFFRESRRPI
jgi:UDP-N-acetylmuramoylalanine--D-glutamate ligase